MRRNSALNDVVIVASLRTPLTKVRSSRHNTQHSGPPATVCDPARSVCLQAKRGGLRDTDAVDLLATVFKAVLAQTKVEPEVRLLPVPSGIPSHGCMYECPSNSNSDTSSHTCHPLPSQAIGDIVIGSVLGPSSQRANEARVASFFAGIPEAVPIYTVNRYVRGWCVSDLPCIKLIKNNMLVRYNSK